MSKFKRNEKGLMARTNSYGRTSYDELAKELGLKKGETLYAVSVENGTRISRPVSKGQKDIPHKPGTSFIAGPTITKAAEWQGEKMREADNSPLISKRASFSRGLSEILRNLAEMMADNQERESNPSPSPAPQRPRGEQRSQSVKNRPVQEYRSCPSHAPAKLPPALKREMEELHNGGFGAIPAPEMTQWGWAVKMKGLVLAGGIRTDAMILLPANYPAVSPIGFYLRKGASTGNLDLHHLHNRSYYGAPDLMSEGWQWFCGVANDWIPGRHNLLSYVSCVFAMFNNEGLRG